MSTYSIKKRNFENKEYKIKNKSKENKIVNFTNKSSSNLFNKKSSRKIFAFVLLSSLILFLIYALIPFRNAFFGAFFLYFLFKPLHLFLTKKLKILKEISALIIILLTILIVAIPLWLTGLLLVTEVNSVLSGTNEFFNQFLELESISIFNYNLNLTSIFEKSINNITDFLKNAIFSTLGTFFHYMLVLTLMYFMLFYLFLNSKNLKKMLFEIIPFNEKNTTKLIEESSKITKSGVIGIGIIAAIQGILTTFGFLIFGIKGAFFWGIVSAVLSVLPIIGPPLIWIPASAILYLNSNYTGAIGFFLWGFFLISGVDNILRPIVQKKIGKIHPLVSLIGVLIGIPFFGFLGIIIGPILVSYSFLLLKMYEEEYVFEKEHNL